ncbi:MAG: hypothetical protein HOV94_27830 [Saccharothrix sp.]|nr:hypothetical protein [Saccharothrix sp.]
MDHHVKRHDGSTTGGDTPRHYEFHVSGLLSDRAQHALSEFSDTVIEEIPPQTVIHADVLDHSQLQGFIALLDNLGLRLLSVQSTPADQAGGERHGP